MHPFSLFHKSKFSWEISPSLKDETLTTLLMKDSFDFLTEYLSTEDMFTHCTCGLSTLHCNGLIVYTVLHICCDTPFVFCRLLSILAKRLYGGTCTASLALFPVDTWLQPVIPGLLCGSRDRNDWRVSACNAVRRCQKHLVGQTTCWS